VLHRPVELAPFLGSWPRIPIIKAGVGSLNLVHDRAHSLYIEAEDPRLQFNAYSVSWRRGIVEYGVPLC
jgi:hypothetical protein